MAAAAAALGVAALECEFIARPRRSVSSSSSTSIRISIVFFCARMKPAAEAHRFLSSSMIPVGVVVVVVLRAYSSASRVRLSMRARALPATSTGHIGFRAKSRLIDAGHLNAV